MRVRRAILFISLMLSLLQFAAQAAQRFPPPEFETAYQIPSTAVPGPRLLVWEYVDVAVLLAALGLATWLALGKRSRKGMVALSLFSLAYFGFYREGCICAIGSVQNVALALGDPRYSIPFSALAFFFLPLAFALFAGRSFCGGVCPHGALQDLVLLKPVRIPLWLERGLGVIPFVYLGGAVLFAVTGPSFIICRYDPFVPFFRLTGGTWIIAGGAALLLIGMFVGRPYCRFLCPFGALLKVSSKVSKWRVRVTPDQCTQCRLCEQGCPFGAIEEPTGEGAATGLSTDRKRLGWLLFGLPLLILAGGWVGAQLSSAASRVHPTVALMEDSLGHVEPAPGAQTPQALALKRAAQQQDELLAEATGIQKKFAMGGWFFGGWVGLVVGVQLIGLSVRPKRLDYEPDRGACFSCARCFEYCPSERQRRGWAPLEPAPTNSPENCPLKA